MMLTPLEGSPLEAVARLYPDKDFQEFSKFLKQQSVDVAIKGLAKDGESAAKYRGAALILIELVEELSKARPRLQRINDKHKGRAS